MIFGTLYDRALLEVSGEEAETFFQRILTIDLHIVGDETLNPCALLSPQGKIQHEILISRHATEFYLDVLAADADTLIKRLKMLKLRSRVQIDRAPLSVNIIPTGGLVDTRHPDAPRRAYTAESETGAWNDERIRLGIPEQGADFGTNDVFPTDVNLDSFNGLDYQKGCFVGQEVISRMKRRGSIRRRTYKVQSAAACATGSRLFQGETEIGEITSTTNDGLSGLARIRVDRWKSDTDTLTEAGDAVTIICPDYLNGHKNG